MSAAVNSMSFAVTRRRFDAAGSVNTAGLVTASAYTDLPCRAHVFPLDAESMARLSEGDRSRGAMGFGSTTEFRISAEGGARADELVWGGVRYEVFESQPWSGPDGTVAYWHGKIRKVVRP